MFERIFIEKDVLSAPRTQKILSHFPKVETKTIDKVEDVFAAYKKPYLEKRSNLNLFLGKKRGQLVKEAPNAYGLSGEPHYYFIHAYNCIYECQYCYLQGYFQSPDIVLFINHEDIGADITAICEKNPSIVNWFHAGEFSDSLALSHMTEEWPYYWDLFSKIPNAKLELRTKSANIREIEKLPPQKNIYVSFSLAPETQTKKYDLKTASLKARLKALQKLQQLGHPVGIHLDPIIYDPQYETMYRELITQIGEHVNWSDISYVSLGVVRFTKDVFQQVQKNYPDSPLLAQEFAKSFDNKIRYIRPMRLAVLKKVQAMLLEAGLPPQRAYLCMED